MTEFGEVEAATQESTRLRLDEYPEPRVYSKWNCFPPEEKKPNDLGETSNISTMVPHYGWLSLASLRRFVSAGAIDECRRNFSIDFS